MERIIHKRAGLPIRMLASAAFLWLTDNPLWRRSRAALRRLATIDDGPAPAPKAARLPPQKGRWADIAALSFLLLAVLFFFHDIVFRGKVFWGADITWFFYPTRTVLGEALRTGNLGPVLWSPDIFGGYPLFAEGQIGALYPLNWLFALAVVPPPTLLSLHIVLHYFLAALFTYLFARTLRIEPAGAVLAGLVFAFSGFMTSHLAHVSLLDASVWLPLLFLFAELLLQRGRWVFLILTSLTLAIQIYAGHPQAALLSAFALAIYIFCRVMFFSAPPASGDKPPAMLLDRRTRLGVLSRPVSNLVRCCLILVLIAALGSALAAAQLVPLYELTGLTLRTGGVQYEWATTYALSAENLSTLVFPFRFGGPIDYTGQWGFAELSLYAGIAPLVLGLVPLLLRPNKYGFLFFFLGGLALLLSLGEATPLFRILHAFPIYKSLRAPGRFVLIVDFALALLSGLGLTILQRAGQLRGAKRWLGFYIAALLLLLLALTGPGGPIDVIRAAWQTNLLGRASTPTTVPGVATQERYFVFFPLLSHSELVGNIGQSVFGKLMRRDYYAAAPWLLAFAAVGVALLARKKWRLGITAAFLVLTLIDLFMFTVRVNAYLIADPAMPPGQVGKGQVDYLQSTDTSFCVYHFRSLPANDLLPWRIPCLDGYSPLETLRHRDYEHAIKNGPAPLKLLSLASARYIAGHISQMRSFDQLNGLPLVWQDGPLQIYENTAALPRAYFVHTAKVAPPEAVLPTLAQPEWIPGKSVVLEEPVELPGASDPTEATVQITCYGPTYAEIQVKTTAAGLLVLNDAAYPGWKAWVDDEETKIYTANYLFRAVPVPAGTHTIEFAYQPASLAIGIAITLLTLVGIAGGAGVFLLWEKAMQRQRIMRGKRTEL